MVSFLQLSRFGGRLHIDLVGPDVERSFAIVEAGEKLRWLVVDVVVVEAGEKLRCFEIVMS